MDENKNPVIVIGHIVAIICVLCIAAGYMSVTWRFIIAIGPILLLIYGLLRSLGIDESKLLGSKEDRDETET